MFYKTKPLLFHIQLFTTPSSQLRRHYRVTHLTHIAGTKHVAPSMTLLWNSTVLCKMKEASLSAPSSQYSYFVSR